MNSGSTDAIGFGLPRKPEIVDGRLYYNGQSARSQPVVKMDQLLSLYHDTELRGVREIFWSTTDISAIEGLWRAPNLRRLTLGNCRISKISGLEYVPLLEKLNLVQNNITRIEGLDGVPNLKELHLDLNRIDRIEGLDGLAKLEVLMLTGNDIEEISGVSQLKALRRLELAGNRLRNIVALRDLPNLELVSIESSRNQLDEESLRFIEEWNAKHAGKPGLQLRSGMPAAGGGQVAPAEPEVEAPAPP